MRIVHTSLMLEALTRILASFETPADFTARRQISPDNIRLAVEGVGPVDLPISAGMAGKMIAGAQKSPYGLRDQTLTDSSVRDSWEIDAAKIETGRRWARSLEVELQEIRCELGLPESARLIPTLDKLLLYGPGQFFVAHQDSEKDDAMVATLVVLLPSSFSGGSLVIHHEGADVTFRSEKRTAENLTLIAFFADCHHEVRPVKSGFRVALVYRLSLEVQDRAGLDGALDPVAPETMSDLTEQVRVHFSLPSMPDSPASSPGRDVPEKLVVLLDHQYTERNLAWSLLKASDRTRAAALRQVASRLDCEVFLALAEIHEMWDCEPDDDFDWRYSRRGRFRGVDDEDLADTDENGYTLSSLIDSSFVLTHWCDHEGNPVDVPQLPVNEDDELIRITAIDAHGPTCSEYEGYMGNYGNTLDRWYHRATVVLWPRAHAFTIRAGQSAHYTVHELLDMAQRGEQTAAITLFRSVLPQWQSLASHVDGKGFFTECLRLAVSLGDRDLAEILLAPLRASAFGSTAVKPWLALLNRYGAQWCHKRWMQWRTGFRHMDQESGFETKHLARLVNESAEKGRALVRGMVATLFEEWQQQLDTDPVGPRLSRRFDPGQDGPVTQALRVFEGCVVCEHHEVHGQLLDLLTSEGSPYSPTQCSTVALEVRDRIDSSKARQWRVDDLLNYSRVQLEAKLAEPERAADDWKVSSPITCSCADCATLAKFLSSSEMYLEWPLAKPRRRHVHEALDGYRLPVTHETVRSGRPFTLVLTKTQELFKREAAERAACEQTLVKVTEALSRL